MTTFQKKKKKNAFQVHLNILGNCMPTRPLYKIYTNKVLQPLVLSCPQKLLPSSAHFPSLTFSTHNIPVVHATSSGFVHTLCNLKSTRPAAAFEDRKRHAIQMTAIWGQDEPPEGARHFPESAPLAWASLLANCQGRQRIESRTGSFNVPFRAERKSSQVDSEAATGK